MRCSYAPYLLAAAFFLGAAGPARIATAQQIELLSGEPFGVGRIVMPAVDPSGDAWADGRIDVAERSGRLLYPVLATGPVRQLLREFIPAPPSTTILFLFTGREPLDLAIYNPRLVNVRAATRQAAPGPYNRLLTAWWRDYSRTAERHARSADYPASMDTYLSLTLARRLSLPAPRFENRGLLGSQNDAGLALLLGTESLHARMERAVLSGASGPREADRPLPPAPAVPEGEMPEPPGNVAIEPIANHVPAEFFYLRTGTFANYVWMRSTLDEWGGDLRNLITQRGVDYQMHQRLERQLALEDTVLSRMFGGTLISDVAIIGADPFLREGAAMGMLFEARNSPLLANSIAQQRANAIAREDGRAKEVEVDIAGQRVKFLSTPDGAVRSYYVALGDYHLVTTSRTVARRFIEVTGGKGSLGASREFRAARARFPVSRDDTLFVYVSQAFLNNLAGPQYRIEMARRMRSAIEIESFRLARLAAAAEKKPGHTVEQLVEADLLPAGFGNRADGSRLLFDGDRIVDSLRGTPGLFVPVADIEVKGAAPAELAEYEFFSGEYRDSPGRLEPIVAAVKRFRTRTAGAEVVHVELNSAPLMGGKLAWLKQFLGEPTNRRMAAVPGDVVRVEGMGQGGNYLFLGLQDYISPAGAPRPVPLPWPLPSLNMFQGYLGGAPTLGLVEPPLRLLEGGLTGPSDEAGYAQHTGGLWPRVLPTMSVVSFNRQLLENVTPRLKFEAASQPAQLRAKVADISQSRLAGSVNMMGYRRALQISLGNAEFLQSLGRQFHVPREKCLALAESLLNVRLVCPLGGTYELSEERDRSPSWVSTAWIGANQQPPADPPAGFTAPLMQWFRGADLELSALPAGLALRADIVLQHKAAGTGFVLPGFPVPNDPNAKPPVEQSPRIEELPPVEELPPPPRAKAA